MSYPYGTQGAPAVGAGAPGLPQRSSNIGADPAGPPLQRIIVRPGDLYSLTPFLTPDWATYCRATTLGKGGRGLGGTSGLALASGGLAHGGAGAGLAASLIEPTPPGTPIAITFAASATIASFLNYQLSGGNGGDATSTAGGSPGVGSGGAINFNGGAGETSGSAGSPGGGGGAAGRGGNGVSGGSSISFGGDGGLGDAYATGGGAGGPGSSSAGSAAAGGLARTSVSQLGAAIIGANTAPGPYTASFATNSNGGDGGGGSGGGSSSAVGTTPNVPGTGLVLIELW